MSREQGAAVTSEPKTVAVSETVEEKEKSHDEQYYDLSDDAKGAVQAARAYLKESICSRAKMEKMLIEQRHVSEEVTAEALKYLDHECEWDNFATTRAMELQGQGLSYDECMGKMKNEELYTDDELWSVKALYKNE